MICRKCLTKKKEIKPSKSLKILKNYSFKQIFSNIMKYTGTGNQGSVYKILLKKALRGEKPKRHLGKNRENIFFLKEKSKERKERRNGGIGRNKTISFLQVEKSSILGM
jgi:hypothetical protein